MIRTHVRRGLRLAVAALLLVPAAPASAASTTRVKDIQPGSGGSSPLYLTAMKVGTKPLLFFSAADGTSGHELWRSDGTAAGTKLVKDINPGTGDSHPSRFTVMKVGTKRLLFFQADDGTSGRELWQTDGTTAGTKRVKDINPGAGSSLDFSNRFTVMNVGTKRLLFFGATDGTSGDELWRTDGTGAGTKRVEDINPGAGGSGPEGLAVMKVGTERRLFFRAWDASSGYELWRSDGTAAGTKRVKDIYPGTDNSSPFGLTVMKIGTKRLLFFQAQDGSSGGELWRSDGTAGGTKRVKDINPGEWSSSPSEFTVMKVGTKRLLLFRAWDGSSGTELWRSDGTGAGTKRVKDIDPGAENSSPGELTVMKVGTERVLFFKAWNSSGAELWRSDGTAAGTKRVKDINPGAADSGPSELTVMKVGTKRVLFFKAYDGSSGYELWRSDGTGAGTKRVKDINPGGSSSPSDLTVMKVGTKPNLFFSAHDVTSGGELWRHRP